MKEKTLTRTLAFITAFVMILAIAPTNLGMSGLFDGLALKASAAYGTDIFGTPTTHSDYTVYELQSGTYTLNSDVLLDHCLYIPAGQMVTINLNGYTLDRGLSSATEGTVDGSVIWNEGYLNLKSTDSYNGVITGGYAVNGGGINNVTTSGSPITGYLNIDKVTIRGNKASQNGGGIFFDGATIIDGISNCRIMNNEAGDCGGGIYISADKTMTLTNTSVTENSADENGGGIYQGGTLSLSTTINNYAFLLSDNLSGSLPNNVYLPSGKTITLANNLTDQSRIYVYAEEDYQTVTTNWNSYGPKNVQASEIIMSDKGGIAVVDEVSGEVLFTAEDSTIVGSWSSLQAEISNAAEPKSIALIRNITAGANDTQIVIPNGKDISINLNGFTISRNLESAQQDGRVFYVQAGGKLTLNSLNSAGTVTGGNTTGNGGAILNEGTLSLSYVSITGNNAVANGGGIYTALGATTTLADYVYVTYNTAGNNGGGIANDGTVNASYLDVTNNQSSGNGGGIWQNGLFNVKNRIIVNENTKTSSANNIYLKSGKVVTLVDKLTNYTVTEMGITMENTAYNVTSGWSTYNDANIAANYFTSDNSALFAEQFGSEIVIGVPYLERYSNGDSQKRAVNNYTELTSATTTLGSGWYIVSGNVTNNNRIYVSNGQTANIILKDGATLTCPKGIAVNAGTTLNIYGQDNDSGKLVAHSDEFNAAIGSDDQDEDSGENGGGNINIYGGTIEATSGDDAAGIGGGNEAGNGNIRIYGGNITAIGATNGAGIGSGDEPETAIGSITIYGGEITASSIKCGAGIGGGFGANGGNITIYGGTITATGGAFAAGIGGGDKGESGNVSIYGGSVTAVGGELAAGIGSGRFKGRPNITIGGNAVVNATGGECAAGIGEGYGCDSTTENGYIAINGGTVTATGGGESAGIGGGEGTNTKCNITITDGTVYAYGGDRSTKHSYTGDTYGCAAGIGAGCFHNGGGDYAGSIKISGGEVHAYSSRQLVYDIKEDCGGAGIGAAYMGNLTGSVEITGGVVEAVGKFGGAAIGAGAEEELGGRGGECEGTVTITGGRVILSIDSENECVFIGHGCDGSEDGTLVLGNNMKVCFDESAPQIAPLRYSTCRTESNDSLIIAECDHPHITYTSTSTTHTAHCYYCNTVFNAETHDPDDNNKCTVCGYQGALYTVSFNANGASGTMQSVTIVPDNNYVLPECTFTPQESKRFKCWSVGGIEKAVGDEITVSANTEVKAIWESLFTVAFNTDGGGEIASQTVVEGNTAAKPDDPQKDGFDFIGWYLDEDEYDFSSAVTESITLVAKWKELIYVDYIDENGELKTTEQSATKITSQTTEIGSGWYFVDGTVSLERLEYSGDVHLILTDGSKLYMTDFCENINGYNVSSIYSTDENGTLSIYGQSAGTGTIYAGDTLNNTLDGELLYTYGSVNIYGGKIASVGSGNCTVTAFGDVTITNGTLTLKSQLSGKNALMSYGKLTISGGTVSASAPSYNAIFGDSVEISGGEVNASTGNNSYGAICAETDGSITITGGNVSARGGKGMWAKNINLGWTDKTDSILSYAYTLDDGGKLTLTKDFKKGNTLYKAGEASTSIKDKNNALIPAEVVTVTFDKDNGTAVNEVLVEKGNSVASPDAPTKDGFDFVGWYLGANAYNFATPVNADITLTAHWEEYVVEIIDGYYYVNGEKTYAGLIMIDGYYYYIKHYGVVATGSYYVTKTNGLLPAGTYDFGDDGRMEIITEETNGIVDGIYYVNGEKTYAGLIEIDGYYYYIKHYGVVATGSSYVTKTNGLLPAGTYDFGDDGRLAIITEQTNGIVDGIYYVNGEKTYAGLIEIDGYYYYIKHYGVVATGSYYVTKTNDLLPAGTYNFGTDGRLIG